MSEATRPDDVSEAAWEFANQLLLPRVGTGPGVHFTARAFDAAVAPLRVVMRPHLPQCGGTKFTHEARATLARFTPKGEA